MLQFGCYHTAMFPYTQRPNRGSPRSTNSGAQRHQQQPIAHTTKILPIDYQLNENDVFCGRGSMCFNHSGNRKFRSIVLQNLDRYSKAVTKASKTDIIYEIVDLIRSACTNGGGFVKRDLETGRFYEIGDFLAREKTSQAFRDALQDKYKSSHAMKKKKRLISCSSNHSDLFSSSLSSLFQQQDEDYTKGKESIGIDVDVSSGNESLINIDSSSNTSNILQEMTLSTSPLLFSSSSSLPAVVRPSYQHQQSKPHYFINSSFLPQQTTHQNRPPLQGSVTDYINRLPKTISSSTSALLSSEKQMKEELVCNSKMVDDLIKSSLEQNQQEKQQKQKQHLATSHYASALANVSSANMPITRLSIGYPSTTTASILCSPLASSPLPLNQSHFGCDINGTTNIDDRCFDDNFVACDDSSMKDLSVFGLSCSTSPNPAPPPTGTTNTSPATPVSTAMMKNTGPNYEEDVQYRLFHRAVRQNKHRDIVNSLAPDQPQRQPHLQQLEERGCGVTETSTPSAADRATDSRPNDDEHTFDLLLKFTMMNELPLLPSRDDSNDRDDSGGSCDGRAGRTRS